VGPRSGCHILTGEKEKFHSYLKITLVDVKGVGAILVKLMSDEKDD
jgi:hypothetical protein